MEQDYEDYTEDEFSNPFEKAELTDQQSTQPTTNEFDQDFFKDEVIFLVDCSHDIFVNVDHDSKSSAEKPYQETFFHIIIKAFINFLKAKIISTPNDKTSLILFNTKKSENPLNFQGVNIVFDLSQSTAERIKNAQNLLDLEFDSKFGGVSDEQNNLYEALWSCNHLFREQGYEENSSKRIFQFTTEDNPCRQDQKTRDQAIHQAEQLSNINVDIELFPIEVTQKFQHEKFYIDLISFDPDDITKDKFNPNTRQGEQTMRLRRKEYKKRVLGRVDLQLSKDFFIATKFFNMVSKAKKPTAVPLSESVNKNQNSIIRYTCQETGAELYPNQIGHYMPLAGEKVIFTPEEIKEIKKFDEPSQTLIGFKPKHRLKDFHNYRSSYFIYPDDDKIGGSSQVFDSLIQEMLLMDKIGIVRFIPKKASAVRFAAQLPQKEEYSEDGGQTPPGFQLIFLPYADDLRNLEQIKMSNTNFGETMPDREQVLSAKRIINAMDFQFSSKNFENPDLQTFYKKLQGVALGEENIANAEDFLLPDYEGLAKIEPLVENFKKKVYGDYDDLIKKNEPSKKNDNKNLVIGKRSTDEAKMDSMVSNDNAQGKKKVQNCQNKAGPKNKANSMIEEDFPEDEAKSDRDFVEDCMKNNTHKSLTVSILKEYLKYFGYTNFSKKLKKDLIEQVEKIISDRGKL